MKLNEFLNLFQNPKTAGSGYLINCPAHSDDTQSLSVTEEGGKILIHCHAGCTAQAIVDSVGLKMSDLFTETPVEGSQLQNQQQNKPHAQSQPKIVATYDYVDQQGKLLFQTVRMEPKNFRQRRPFTQNGSSYAWGLSEGWYKQYKPGRGDWYKLKRNENPAASPDHQYLPEQLTVLYRLPEVIEAIKQGRPIYICEGEKDADNLRALGLVTTTVPLGAGKWRDYYAVTLQGAKVIILPDFDKLNQRTGKRPGTEGAIKIAQGLKNYAAAIKIVELPGLQEGQDVSDWIAAGGKKEELQKIHAAVELWKHESENDSINNGAGEGGGNSLNNGVLTSSGESGLPKIQVEDRHLRDISDETLSALNLKNDPPVIFKRGAGLIRIVMVEDKGKKGKSVKRPVLEEAGESYLRGLAARSADFIRLRKTKNGYIEIPEDPPLNVIRDIVAMGEWPFPLIQGITQSPILREDGSVFDSPGYDPASCLYYKSEGDLSVPPIPEHPTKDDLINAAALLKEPFLDFPFVKEVDMVNAMGTVIAITLRTLIDGPCPAVMLNKRQQGSGATLLGNVFSVIGNGSPAYVETWPTGKNSEEELRKRITSILMEARPLVMFDNIENRAQSAVLGAALTSEKWQDRLLGKNALVSVPQRTIWILNGNNLQVSGDLPRRCYEVAIDPKLPRPWQRKPENFKHPMLIEWVQAHRGEILGAIFTMARGWIQAGRPVPADLPVLGGFEEWTRVVGGILAHSGVEGFLQNLTELYEKSETDDGWAGFLAAWYGVWGEGRIKVAEVIKKLQDDEEFANSLPGNLDINDKSLNRKMGNRLREKEGVRFVNGLFIERSGTAQRAVEWRVRLTPGYEMMVSGQLNLGWDCGEDGGEGGGCGGKNEKNYTKIYSENSENDGENNVNDGENKCDHSDQYFMKLEKNHHDMDELENSIEKNDELW